MLAEYKCENEGEIYLTPPRPARATSPYSQLKLANRCLVLQQIPLLTWAWALTEKLIIK